MHDTSILAGKHIILGITGGIAAYKSASLVRLFVKAGAEVQVIMTPNARQFIAPVTMSTLSGKPVITEFFTANSGEWHSHVDLGLWADAMVIAPATASTIGKMAGGVADNMLVTTYLSAKCPVFVAPAMDLDMMAHPSTTRNIEYLRSYGNHIIEPAAGELASHLIGKGRMEEPENIVVVLADFFARASKRDLDGKHVMVTAGPTHEPIDPVRYIANSSSGKMGYALAEKAARRGARVTLISGPVNISTSVPGIDVIHITTARDMLEAAIATFKTADIAIMAAAVADYRPEVYHDHKIKRESDSGLQEITLVKNPDIAALLGKAKHHGQKLIGFALETDNEQANALSKIHRKNLDAIVLNSLRQGECFGVDTNIVKVFDRDGNILLDSPLKAKSDLADDILDVISSI